MNSIYAYAHLSQILTYLNWFWFFKTLSWALALADKNTAVAEGFLEDFMSCTGQLG